MDAQRDQLGRSLTRQEQQSLDVFNRHAIVFRSGNIHGVVADFAENAVVITPDGTFEGKNGIRTFYEGLLGQFGNIETGDSPGLFVDALIPRDNLLFLTWHGESLNHIFEFGTDTFVIDEGKIRTQTIAFSAPKPKS